VKSFPIPAAHHLHNVACGLCTGGHPARRHDPHASQKQSSPGTVFLIMRRKPELSGVCTQVMYVPFQLPV